MARRILSPPRLPRPPTARSFLPRTPTPRAALRDFGRVVLSTRRGGGGVARVRGLRELQRDLAAFEGDVPGELRKELAKAAEPIRSDAERLAASGIPMLGLPWSQMRIGVTSRSVYVAPRKRATRNPSRRRPNLADLLMGRAMQPALEMNVNEVVGHVESVLDQTMRRHGL